jgi:2-dehydro-3-deoxyphosphogluconate aldolase/(4S)-4-hydroxy-2-oxoglutarate aldolase
MNAAKLLEGVRVVPVVVVDESETAVELSRTLFDAGLRAIEVTLRTPDALESIRNIAAEVPDILLGAGSVRHAHQVKEVVDAGAQFAVCPGSSPALLEAVGDANLPFIPGAVTPTEALTLLERGYTLQKFFPAEASGGTNFLRGLGAPLPEVSFMPTGGITHANAPDYLQLGNVACLGGTWIAPAALLHARNYDAIASLARAAAEL